MKIVAITGKRTAELRDVPDPRVRENFVRVKIHSAPMCTELKSYANGEICSCLGHEACGEVVEVAQPGKVRVGDRVAVMPGYPCGKCRMCVTGDYLHCEHSVDPLQICGSETGTATYAQYLIKQDWLLLPLPPGVSYDHGAMACCGLGPTFGAMQHMRVEAADTVLVLGLGPVGLGGIINGVSRGATVLGVEGNPFRRKLALELGAKAIFDPADPDVLKQIRDATGGTGVDKTIDCTGIPPAQKLAIDSTRRRGHVTFVGWGGHIEMGNMIPGGLTLQGCWHWNLRDAFTMMRLIERTSASLNRLITHTFPMSKINEAWEVQLAGQCGKIILHPWE